MHGRMNTGEHSAGILRGCLAAAAIALPGPVFSSDVSSGSLVVLSDSIYRGISQTRGNPAVQAGFYRELTRGWSLGAALSTVTLGTSMDTGFELSGSLTRAWHIGESWSASASCVYYLHPKEQEEHDYTEWVASLTYRDRLTATVAYSPEMPVYGNAYTAWREPAVSYELSALHPLSARWSAIAGVGYHDLHEAVSEGYRFFSAGVLFSWDSLQVDLLRIDTDSTALRLFGPERAGGRWSAGLTWKF